MMERVAKQVREETGGSVEIQTFPAGQLGSSRDVIESASSGAIQIVDEGAANSVNSCRSSLSSKRLTSGAIRNRRRVLASPVLDEMNTMLVPSARCASSLDVLRQAAVTSGSKAINTVEDMKGFKLRIPEVDTDPG